MHVYTHTYASDVRTSVRTEKNTSRKDGHDRRWAGQAPSLTPHARRRSTGRPAPRRRRLRRPWHRLPNRSDTSRRNCPSVAVLEPSAAAASAHEGGCRQAGDYPDHARALPNHACPSAAERRALDRSRGSSSASAAWRSTCCTCPTGSLRSAT